MSSSNKFGKKITKVVEEFRNICVEDEVTLMWLNGEMLFVAGAGVCYW